MHKTLFFGLLHLLIVTIAPGPTMAFAAPLVLGEPISDNTGTRSMRPDGDSVLVDRIFVIGNRKTKEKIILRELDFTKGDWLQTAALESLLEKNRQKIINTRLFLSATLTTVNFDTNKIDVIIRVEERWYFFPVPIFELADRNFTEWWVNQKRDLRRVEYGIKLQQFNFRGRNETVSLTAQFGYTKLFRLLYQIPYIDKKQKVGMWVYADYSANKNIATSTLEHKLQFTDAESFLREQIRGGASVTYRPSFYHYHEFGLFYSGSYVADTIPQINPNYFPDSLNTLNYFGLNYSYTRDKRDYVGYPLHGSYLEASVRQTGIGIYGDINILKLNVSFSKYIELGKRFFFGTNLKLSTSMPEKQPYRHYNGIGFGENFMRAYERYVIEGPHWMLNSNSLRINLLNKEFSISKFLPIRQFSTIPLALYFTLNVDQGFVANYEGYFQNTRFSDKYLAGGGIGLDVVTFYDFVLRWEYSVNIDGEYSLYLNIGAPF